jgi:hypothetical protein
MAFLELYSLFYSKRVWENWGNYEKLKYRNFNKRF